MVLGVINNASKAIRSYGRNASLKVGYLCSFLLAAPMIPHALASPAPPVLTVCEALRDIGLYAGKDVVIVGYSGWVFEGSFMHEKCESDDRIAIQGHRWLSVIELSRADPPARPEPFPVEEPVLREKLSHLNNYNSAEGKKRQEQGLDARGVGRLSLSGTWVAAYGRLESPSKLKAPAPPSSSDPRNKSGDGYGANGSVPARLLVTGSMAVPPRDY
jgi:hypothetical protein